MKKYLTILTVLVIEAKAAALAPPLPKEQWDAATRLTLAQAMVGEADWHQPDHIAIAWVLARRWHTHQKHRDPLAFRKYIRLYSASLRSDSKRSKWVQALPWGPLEGAYRRHWDRVKKLVLAWGAGRVKDPCPSAVHWGGTMDRPSKRWTPVSCGLTKNIFYSRQPRPRFASK